MDFTMFAPMRWTAGVIAAVVFVSNASAAIYTQFGFSAITNNSANQPLVDDLAGQFYMIVSDDANGDGVVNSADTGKVSFTFYNHDFFSTAQNSKILAVYLDDGAILRQVAVEGSAGVIFAQQIKNNDNGIADLPSGNNLDPDFETSSYYDGVTDMYQAFNADVNGDPLDDSSGATPLEWLRLVYELEAGMGYGDVIAFLTTKVDGDDPGTLVGANEYGLRVGLHIGGLDNNQSESLLNNPGGTTVPGPGPDPAPTPLPEPTSLAAWLLGSAGLGLILRGRMKKAAA